METITVVIPCYNESENIEKLVNKITELNQWSKENQYLIEIIIVNDASTDNSVDLIQKKNISNLRVINHEENKNLGGVLKTGINNATGKYLMTIDADGTYDPLDLISRIKELEDKSVDFLSGTGLLKFNFYTSSISLKRKVFSFFLPFLYNLILFRISLTYTSLFRLYRTEILRNIEFNSTDFVALAEIFIRLIKKGYRVKEFGASYNAPEGRVSSMNVVRTIKGHLSLMKNIVLGRLK